MPWNENSSPQMRTKCATPGARAMRRLRSPAKKSAQCWMKRLPRAKRILIEHCPTVAPDWIGFFGFRESFELRLAATLAPALLLVGAAAGTNPEEPPLWAGCCGSNVADCSPATDDRKSVPGSFERGCIAEDRGIRGLALNTEDSSVWL